MGYTKLWIGFGAVILLSFAVLGYYGRQIYRQAPPIPERVVTDRGKVLFSGQDIRDGQNVWQSLGGHQLGSIWGHGAYVAPDWSADWLHRECAWLLDHWSEREHGKVYDELSAGQQAGLRARLRETIRTNTYDATTGEIIGTFHHLYFTGTPTAVLALGATFSALEVVPLVLIGFEAYENLTLSRARPWVTAYKWPIYFFIAVAFWNLVGAGLFGFLINPPIALYYMQGLNTTPVHGHTALFGVYGLLGMGLSLFCLKGLGTHHVWRTGVLSFSFWAINIGLALMVLMSLLPVGLAQTWASVEYGLWYARSAEFLQNETLHLLRWLRVVGDTVFAAGIFGFVWFVAGLKTGWSLVDRREQLGEAVEASDVPDAGRSDVCR